jgi:hypothetical protein
MTARILSLELLLSLPVALAAQTAPPAARICMAPASIEGNAGNPDTAMSAVRETFTSFLTGPSMGVTPLSARLESQVREEAKAATCPYLLFTKLNHEHKSGGGGGFLHRMAGSAASQGAYAAAGSVGGSTAERIATNAAAEAVSNAAYSYATTTKAKDELTLSYRLESGSGGVLLDKSDKRKADADGQDLLTPEVQKAAEAIAAVVKAPAK